MDLDSWEGKDNGIGGIWRKNSARTRKKSRKNREDSIFFIKAFLRQALRYM
jgi:hypothetical protein